MPFTHFLRTAMLQATVLPLSLRGTARTRQITAVSATAVANLALSPWAEVPPAAPCPACPSAAEMIESLEASLQEDICWRVVPPTMLFTLAPTATILVAHAFLLHLCQQMARMLLDRCSRRFQSRNRNLALVKAFLRGGGTLRQLSQERGMSEEELFIQLLEE